jgi:glutaredoxin 3
MQAVIWSKYNCALCDQAKALLNQNSIPYEDRRIGEGWAKEDLLEVAPHARSVPQIFLNEEYVGGFLELRQKLTQG